MKSLEQIITEVRWDEQGLVPVIVQDALSKEVLMMAYADQEALRRSVNTGEAWFWSRSRKEYWHKGATSGNVLQLRELRVDCDADTLLMLAVPAGPACHTGSYSCFAEQVELNAAKQQDGRDKALPERADAAADRFAMLSRLEQVIAEREAERPEGAYTTYLFDQGVDKILKKVGEESAEVIIAAKNKDNVELRMETSDLIFHLMVLLRERKLSLDEVLKELQNRHAK